MESTKKFPATHIRIARPTDQLEKIREFYHIGLGLEIISSFEDHNGYDGLMLGLPGREFHLEFTSHKAGSLCPAPTKDNLLVLYIPESMALEQIRKRLFALGYEAAEPENPFWQDKSVTIEDPDGWRVVLYYGSY
jgi:hypothetical protein